MPVLIRRLGVRAAAGEQVEDLRGRLAATKAALRDIDALVEADWTRDDSGDRVGRSTSTANAAWPPARASSTTARTTRTARSPGSRCSKAFLPPNAASCCACATTASYPMSVKLHPARARPRRVTVGDLGAGPPIERACPHAREPPGSRNRPCGRVLTRNGRSTSSISPRRLSGWRGEARLVARRSRRLTDPPCRSPTGRAGRRSSATHSSGFGVLILRRYSGGQRNTRPPSGPLASPTSRNRAMKSAKS